MINVAICDDDVFYLKQLVSLLEMAQKDLKIEFCIQEFASGAQFEAVMQNFSFDLVFMDIELNEFNGVEIIEKLKRNNNATIVIFVTNYDCYVSKVFRIGAFQYLKKPISYDDLLIDLKRAIEKIKNNKQTILLPFNQTKVQVNLSDIYYFEIIRGNTYVCINGDKVKLDKRISLISIANKLNDNFVKIHNAIIVNINNVENVSHESVNLKNNIQLNFSRSFKKNFMDKYNLYLSGVSI